MPELTPKLTLHSILNGLELSSRVPDWSQVPDEHTHTEQIGIALQNLKNWTDTGQWLHPRDDREQFAAGT